MSPRPDLIRWARTRRRWTVLGLARRLKVPRERLAAWEAGEARPTEQEARSLARACGVTWEALCADEPPTRNLGGRPPRGEAPRERLTVFVESLTARALGDGATGRRRAGEILDAWARKRA